MPSIGLRVLVMAAFCLLACTYSRDPAGNVTLAYSQRPRSMPVAFDVAVIRRFSEERVPGARVMMMRHDTRYSRTPIPPQPPRLSATANGAGKLRLRDLAPGDYTVCATDGRQRRGVGLQVRAGQRVRITLRLDTPREFDGCELFLGWVGGRH